MKEITDFQAFYHYRRYHTVAFFILPHPAEVTQIEGWTSGFAKTALAFKGWPVPQASRG